MMMKTKILTLALSLFIITGSAIAQTSNLVIFSEAGKPFTLVLNGVKQNLAPRTNIKVTQLNQPGYNLQVLFEDPSIASINKNVYMQPGMEEVVVIKQNKKGEYVLRLQSQVAIAQAPEGPATQTVVVYGTPQNQPIAPANSGVTSTTVTTSSTTTPNQNVNVGAQVGGVGINMNVNTNGIGTTGTTTTTTTTTTSSTSSSTGYQNTNYNQRQNHHNNGGYNHTHYANGCYGPMSPSDFASAKDAINKQSFSDGKMKVAKQILGSNCMSSEQVKDIMSLFSYESSKLAFAKFAYGRTTDPQNFYKLNSAFSFSSSVDELDSYIKSHPAR